MAKINIIAAQSRFGIDVDIDMISAALSDTDHRLRVIRPNKNFGKVGRALELARHTRYLVDRADLNLFLGPIFGPWLPFAARNVLIPNIEWQDSVWIPKIKQFERVFCKNDQSTIVFEKLGCPTTTTGFTSRDASRPGIVKNYNKILHISSNAGKGTGRLMEAWARRPDLPLLTIVSNRRNIGGTPFPPTPDNVALITDYLPFETIRRMQNEFGIHICCSEAEGFGHYIVEAMSVGALVLTTDGAPMNELIQPDRGLLIPVEHREPMNLGERYLFDQNALLGLVDQALAMTEQDKVRLGSAARNWYLERHQMFGRRFRSAIEDVLRS